ncbi:MULTISPECIES: glycosyltransferase family A protein [Pseudomonas]|uniref:glycosyltransferase family 2 protein n=1 Tax=Pseudomonas TaxID=286 RepID=UPI0009E52245|nr:MULTISPECIES: glycosyltransferase family A protein [Pseudomonas]
MYFHGVSVVIAAKDEALHVREAVSSILNQSDVDFELIFVDDGSKDSTYSIVCEMAASDSRLKVLKNPGAGKCSAFNYGVSMATGSFVCIFAGDDLMPPGSLSQRFKAVSAYSPSLPVVGLCKLKTISEDKKFDGQIVPKATGVGGFTGVSYLMSRPVLDKIFPVPESLPNEDTWMEVAVRYMPGWTIVHSDVIGCHWRVHSGNSINMQLSFSEYNRRLTPRMSAFERFYDKHRADLDRNGIAFLKSRIECEHARASGSVLGVLTSSAPLVDRLRALSATNSFFYELRRRLFKLLSGF